MKLTDIAPLEEWMALEREANARSGMDVNVFDPKGYRISPQKHWANRLCPAIKETDKGQSFICAPAHVNIATAAMRARKTAIEECDAGLVKLVVPIFAGEEFLGAVGACGMVYTEGEIDAFLINKTTEIEEEKIETLGQSVPRIERAAVEALAAYIEGRVAEILAAPRTP